jgi:hypothetical protein
MIWPRADEFSISKVESNYLFDQGIEFVGKSLKTLHAISLSLFQSKNTVVLFDNID